MEYLVSSFHHVRTSPIHLCISNKCPFFIHLPSQINKVLHLIPLSSICRYFDISFSFRWFMPLYCQYQLSFPFLSTPKLSLWCSLSVTAALSSAKLRLYVINQPRKASTSPLCQSSGHHKVPKKYWRVVVMEHIPVRHPVLKSDGDGTHPCKTPSVEEWWWQNKTPIIVSNQPVRSPPVLIACTARYVI